VLNEKQKEKLLSFLKFSQERLDNYQPAKYLDQIENGIVLIVLEYVAYLTFIYSLYLLIDKFNLSNTLPNVRAISEDKNLTAIINTVLSFTIKLITSPKLLLLVALGFLIIRNVIEDVPFEPINEIVGDGNPLTFFLKFIANFLIVLLVLAIYYGCYYFYIHPEIRSKNNFFHVLSYIAGIVSIAAIFLTPFVACSVIYRVSVYWFLSIVLLGITIFELSIFGLWRTITWINVNPKRSWLIFAAVVGLVIALGGLKDL